MNETIAIVSLIGGILAILGGYTTLVYKIATLTATINDNTKLILEVRNIVVNQDARMDKVETRLTIIETQHASFHKERE
jgi:hypothetical protein